MRASSEGLESAAGGAGSPPVVFLSAETSAAAAAGTDELSSSPGWAAGSIFWSFVLGSFVLESLAVLGSLAVALLSAFTVVSEDLSDLAASSPVWSLTAGG